MRLIADYIGDGIDLEKVQLAINMARAFVEKLDN